MSLVPLWPVDQSLIMTEIEYPNFTNLADLFE